MSYYRRLNRKSEYFVAIQIRKVFPELKLTTMDIEERLDELDFEFYEDVKVKTPFWIRLTLLPAFVVMAVLFFAMPINYILTGKWGYKFNWLSNWLRALGF